MYGFVINQTIFDMTHVTNAVSSIRDDFGIIGFEQDWPCDDWV